MARRPRTQRLNVYLNARLVGRLEKAGTGAVSFRYDPDWLGWQGAMPVSISMSRISLASLPAASVARATIVWAPSERSLVGV